MYSQTGINSIVFREVKLIFSSAFQALQTLLNLNAYIESILSVLKTSIEIVS